MRVNDQVVVITGGAGGIGRETAVLFAREGAKVVVADFVEEAGKELVQELNAKEDKHLFVRINVADPQEAQRMVEAIVNHYGRLDILINNAGITRDALLKKMSTEQWQQVLDVNLSGVFYCTQAALPQMLDQGRGCIINTSSVVGVHGNIGQTNYAATKAGVIGMTKTWAKELGPKGIRVNAVAPGFIATPMVDSVPEKLLEKLTTSVPLRRLGEPRDIANAYLFLASSEASYINGTVLEVDGGLVI